MVSHAAGGAEHPYTFCTYFDQRYLPHGLVLYQSLRRHCPDFRLWVLCMDPLSHQVLTNLALPGMTLIALDELESGDAPLRAAKQNRSLVEYYFTCTPNLPLFILARQPELKLLTYVDADLGFFMDPAPLFAELGTGSISLIAHRFPPVLQHIAAHGLYNVGWLTFRRDASGLAALHWWRERCLEWCYDHVEPGRFADQKYLDDWPSRFPGVVVLQHKGANLAPWNVINYDLREHDGHIWVDDQPLIFYHYHRLKRVTTRLFDTNLDAYSARLTPLLRHRIYEPYVRELNGVASAVMPAPPLTWGLGHRRLPRTSPRLPRFAQEAKWLAELGLHLLIGQCVWA